MNTEKAKDEFQYTLTLFKQKEVIFVLLALVIFLLIVALA